MTRLIFLKSSAAQRKPSRRTRDRVFYDSRRAGWVRAKHVGQRSGIQLSGDRTCGKTATHWRLATPAPGLLRPLSGHVTLDRGCRLTRRANGPVLLLTLRFYGL